MGFSLNNRASILKAVARRKEKVAEFCAILLKTGLFFVND
jgi:hypothetical protein